ncbi:DMT family transporter [Emcibacter nanhaiensis]|uniref:DMT family transporter n=1 Tax=Emcibacter nanhaiensis TaxID=1505037 RepID=A0A501PAS1_9PROT|nr:DMT family transporter [Emcibacter nanhaiensis]TPD57489.1 DMT family transporter [Emcibacter nanhaiensis]
MTRSQANLTLTLAAFIWGISFAFQKLAMDDMGPFLFNGLRFLIGGLVLIPLIYLMRERRRSRNRPISRHLFWGSGLAGVVMYAGAAFQQIGIMHTTVTNTGFITSLYMLLVPVLGLFLGHRYARGLWLAVLIAAAGLYLITGMYRGTSLNYGDIMVFIGAVCWAVHVLTIDHLTSRHDQILIAVIQFLVCAFFSLTTAFIVGENMLPASADGWTWILLSGILSVGIGFTLQVVGQADAPPAQAAVILNLEAVFASVAGVLFFQEILSAPVFIGCLLMLGGCLLAQRYPPLPAAHRA